MSIKKLFSVIVVLMVIVNCTAMAAPLADNINPPAETAKLIFIHHSCGENWLTDWDGGLGLALRDNNYFVSDTNYGWGPHSVGDNTDIGHWWNWFRGPDSQTYLNALYTEYGQHSEYTRLPDPAPNRENEIIMFKSCFPNSYLGGNPNAAPTTGDNPLRGQESGSGQHTVANAKGIYNDLLEYFATRQDKLFIAVTAPPQVQAETDATHAANARAFNNWLVNDWLADYPYDNVAVFDFYNVLTSNGGNIETNDAGAETGNHHRWWNGAVQHIQAVNNNYSAYGVDDSHPTSAGNQKAVAEFVPLLNLYYHRWKADAPAAPATPAAAVATVAVDSAAEPTATTAVPTATPMAEPTAVELTPGQYTIVFQEGVSPDASYAGTSDAILASDAEPNANLGATENLETFFGEGEEMRRSLIRWELSSLPANVSVESATIELYRYDGDAASEMEVALYRVTEDWTEGTGSDLWPAADYVPNGATWNEAAPGAAWSEPGGNYDAAVVARATLPLGMNNDWISLNATAAARSWIEQDAPNYGVLLRPESGDYTYHYYASSEYATPEQRPRLTIVYTVGDETAPDSDLPPVVGLMLRIYRAVILESQAKN